VALDDIPGIVARLCPPNLTVPGLAALPNSVETIQAETHPGYPDLWYEDPAGNFHRGTLTIVPRSPRERSSMLRSFRAQNNRDILLWAESVVSRRTLRHFRSKMSRMNSTFHRLYNRLVSGLLRPRENGPYETFVLQAPLENSSSIPGIVEEFGDLSIRLASLIDYTEEVTPSQIPLLEELEESTSSQL